MGKYVAALYQGHDASIAVVGEGRIAHLELERFTRVKHDGGDCIDMYHKCLALLGIDDSEVVAAVGVSGALVAGYQWSDYNAAPLVGNVGHGPLAKPTYAVPHHTAHLAYAFYTSPYVEARLVAQDGGGDNYLIPFYGGTSVDCVVGDGNHPFGSDGHFDARWHPPMMIGGTWVTASDHLFGRPYAEGSVMALAGMTEEQFAMLSGQPLERWHDVQRLQAYSNMVFDRLVHPDRVGPVCLAGGSALNGIAMYKLLKRQDVTAVHVPPAVHDGGIPVGAALFILHKILGEPRHHYSADAVAFAGWTEDGMDGELPAERIAEAIAAGKVVAVANGRAESGPRALGHRSFLADPRNPEMKDRINQLKGREQYRPVAPAILRQYADEYFDLKNPDCYTFMTMIADSRERAKMELPAALHVDGSARVQVVESNVGLGRVIEAFRQITGCPAVLNTSFNLAGEAMVNGAGHARDTFGRSTADMLVIGSTVEVE